MGLPSEESIAIKGYHKSKVALKAVGVTLFATSAFMLCLFVATSIAESKTAGFTISVKKNKQKDEGYPQISLSETEGFANPTTNLTPEGISDIYNISSLDIPADVDNYYGSHNGEDYLAYSFFVKNSGTAGGYINESFNLLVEVGGADDAIRIRIYRDGVATTYAKASSDGSPEFGTTPFAEEKVITNETYYYDIDQITKYTIVIWLDGDDPQCTDKIQGSELKFDLTFKVDDDYGSSSDTETE